MRDVGRLVDAICEAYNLALNHGPFSPTQVVPRFPGALPYWTTHCNEAVNLIAKRMGYNMFDLSEGESDYRALLADQMFDLMSASDSSWYRVTDARTAQDRANKGALIVMAWKSPDSGHGHICVVMPGMAQWSPTWSESVPSVMNIGRDVFIGKKASFAFRANDKPGYFGLRRDVMEVV